MIDEKSTSCDGFPALWASHQGTLLIYIMGAVPRFHDAQDILQKVAVVAFRKQQQFEPDHMEFAAWVRAIARYEILHYRRDHARDRLVFDETTLEKLGAVQQSLGHELESRFAALRGCLDAIRGRARTVVELRYRDGLTPSAIAERLNSTANSINVTLAKVRRSLRACVERRLQAPSD